MLKNIIKLKWKVGFYDLTKSEFYEMYKLIDSLCDIVYVETYDEARDSEFWTDVFVIEGTEKKVKELMEAINERMYEYDWGMEPF